MDSFSARLKQIIDNKGLSQAEAARACGIAQQSMNYILKNDLSSSKLAPQIAEALDINPEWLIYGTGRPNSVETYEVPILHSAYLLEKFLNNELQQDSVDYTVIDTFLGHQTFAYLTAMNELVICTPTPSIFNPREYLHITPSGINIIKVKAENSYAIFEQRKRANNY